MLTKKMSGIAIALIVVAIAATLTATGVFAKGPQDRPFNAPVTGVFHPDGPTGCAPDAGDLLCDFVLTGEGTATHMGAVTTDSTWVVRIEDTLANPATTKGHIVFGSVTITAAYGDTVTADALPGSRLDDGTTNARFDISGGTGRFADATGVIYRVGVFAIVDPSIFLGEFDVTYEGTIGY